VPPGERLVVEMPGGGSYGDPLRRDRDKVQRDVLLGFVSAGAARESYGCD
jgi:N-methylhydantoinase B